MPSRKRMGRRKKCRPLMVFVCRKVVGLFRWDKYSGLRYLDWGVLEYPLPDALDWYSEVWQMPRRPAEVTVPKATKAGSVCKLLKNLPLLSSYLLDLTYEDDPATSREPSTLFVKFQAGDCMIWLGDPSTESQIRVAAPTLSDALAALELAVASDSAVWTPRPADRGRAGQKRKK